MSYVPVQEDFVLTKREYVPTAAESVSGTKHESLKRFFSKKINIIGVSTLTLLVLLAVFAPMLSGSGYDEQNLTIANQAPNAAHWFGTDSLGRDLFARCFMGLRVSLIIALAATVIDLIIGMNYGIISGYFGGLTDIIMMRVLDVIGSIPTLVVVTLLMLVLQPGMGAIIIALMLTGWIEMSLIARAQVVKVKELEYVQAARTMGAGHMHIIFKDIMPNILDKLVTQIMLSVPAAVFLEAFLSFIGLGMPVGTCSLGTLLSNGFDNALLYPFKLIPVACVMILLMIACHLIAEGIKNATSGRE